MKEIKALLLHGKGKINTCHDQVTIFPVTLSGNWGGNSVSLITCGNTVGLQNICSKTENFSGNWNNHFGFLQHRLYSVIVLFFIFWCVENDF
jgi:hypothetical protein